MTNKEMIESALKRVNALAGTNGKLYRDDTGWYVIWKGPIHLSESAMMYRGGFTWHSVEVNKITRLEGNKGTAICTYHPNAPYPYNARISLHDQANDFGIGCKDFSEIMRYVL